MNYSSISTTSAWMLCSKQPNNPLILSERKSSLAREFSVYTKAYFSAREIAAKVLENQAFLLNLDYKDAKL